MPDPGNAVSCGTCFRLPAIAAELAKQSVAVLGDQFSQMSDERLDLLTAGLPQIFGAAELGCILLDCRGIQPVLADQQAELVAELGLAAAVSRLRRKLPHIRLGLTASWR